MKLSHSFLCTALLARHSFATLHHLFVSSYTTPDIWTLELDDVRKTLRPIGNTTGHDGHPVLSFSYDRSIIYGGEVSGFSSYHIGGDNPYAVTYNSSVGLGGDCATANKRGYGSTAIAAEAKGPYMVYGAPLAGCGEAIAVDTDLDLDFITQNYTYNRPNSAIRGLTLDIDNTILYSADVGASGIWASSVDPITGVLTSIGFLPSHIANAGPRKILAHPSGKYIYVLLERSNMVAVYAVNKPKDGTVPKQGPISFTGLTYSLLPSYELSTNFWASDMSLSEDGSRLLATTRYRLPTQANSVDTVPGTSAAAPRPVSSPVYSNPYLNQNQGQSYPAYSQNQPSYNQQQPYRGGQQQQQPYRGGQQQQNPYYNTNNGGRGKSSSDSDDDSGFKTKTKRRTGVGYVTAILLTPSTEAENADTGTNVGWGYPIRKLFQTQTSTSGGMSNSISAAPWGDNFFAITDSEFGVVEVWKIDGLDVIDYGGALGQDGLTKTVGGWSLGQWSPTGQLSYSEATDNTGASAVVNSGGWAEGRPRAQVPESYYNPPPRATAAAPPVAAPAPAAQPTSNLPPWLGGSSDPNSFTPGDPTLPNGANSGFSAVQSDPNAPVPGPSPVADATAAAPTPSPSKSWLSNLFGWRAVNDIQENDKLHRRQAPAAAAAAAPPITARVFAYWRAPAVQSKFPQAGCCSNPLWYD